MAKKRGPRNTSKHGRQPNAPRAAGTDPVTMDTPCPTYVTDTGKPWWPVVLSAVVDTGGATGADTLTLALLADALGGYIEVRDEAAAVNPICVSESGGIYQHPLVALEQRRHERVVKLLKECGLTPASRDAVRRLPDKPKPTAEDAKKAAYFK